MLTGILSVIWSLGLMGLLGVHLDPLNTTTPILVLAVAAGHAIQILKRYYEEYGRLRATGMAPREANREAVVESMVRVGPVMIVAGLIAVITFLSLAGTGIPMVQHFGVFAGCGVLATMVIEMTVIPAVRSMLRPPKEREAARERKAGVLDRFLTGVADNLVGGRAPVDRRRRARWCWRSSAPASRCLRIDNNFKLYFKPDSDGARPRPRPERARSAAPTRFSSWSRRRRPTASRIRACCRAWSGCRRFSRRSPTSARRSRWST